MILETDIIQTMDSYASHNSCNQSEIKVSLFLYFHRQECDKTSRDDMQERTDKASSQSHIEQTYLFVIDKAIAEIEKIFYHTKSQSHQDTIKNQISEIVLSFFFEEDIIARRIFQILFSICSDDKIEDEDINTEQVSSVADSHKKYCSQEDCLQNFGISSSHEECQKKHEGETVGHKQTQADSVRIVHEIKLGLSHWAEEIFVEE